MLNKNCTDKIITIVSGLPRSGTSMMMSMIKAGGMDVLVDNFRKLDEDNPKGYYEYEKVKNIKDDKSWMEKAAGKAVKMVTKLLYYLPDDKKYKIVFMKRKLEEIIISQNQMLKNLNKVNNEINDSVLLELFEKHLSEIDDWFKKRDNIEVLYMNYYEVISNPLDNALKLKTFLSNIKTLNIERIVNVVDINLYRKRI